MPTIYKQLAALLRTEPATAALSAILEERARQESRFHIQVRPAAEWSQIITALTGELARAILEQNAPAIDHALTQIGATAAAALEDNRATPPTPTP